MDGVLYRGSTANNSIYTALDVVFQLRKIDIETTQEHVYTSGIATAAFLPQQKPNRTAFVILKAELFLPSTMCNTPLSAATQTVSWWAKAGR